MACLIGLGCSSADAPGDASTAAGGPAVAPSGGESAASAGSASLAGTAPSGSGGMAAGSGGNHAGESPGASGSAAGGSDPTSQAGSSVAGMSAGGAAATGWEPSCPAGFVPQAGLNTGFMSDSKGRQFHLLLPADTSSPRPLFVALTGTVQSETDFLKQSRLDQLTKTGWIVMAPVRSCSQEQRNCNGSGSEGSMDGRPWEPWFDVGGPGGDDDAGPDVRLIIAAIRCVATKYSVDQRRIYHGGISAGGSMSNHLLFFAHDFFAGGVPASGVMYGGRVAPKGALAMQPSIGIVIWGGVNDKWPLDNPIADYAPETKAAALELAAQKDVVTLACSGNHGHAWPGAMTPWLAATLLSHPKGSAPADFQLTPPPEGLGCVLGAYTDH